jgi:threonine dehydrogenase-like Zn-dependent dehydrogenase
MRAAIFHNPGEPLTIENMPDPTPATTQVVVRVGRCGICGTDLSMTKGPIHYEKGSALGHEFAGEVVGLGTKVNRVKLGDFVSAMPISGCGECAACAARDPFMCTFRRPMMGGFGEYTLATQSSCVILPAGHSITDGALVEPLAVGLHSAKLAGIRPGAEVLVLGAGPIALASAFWVRELGATTVTMMARSDRHRSIAENMGVTDFISFDSDAAQKSACWEHVFECTGAPGMLGRAIDMVRPRGAVLLSGLCLETDSILPAVGVFKEAIIRTAVGYNLDEFKASLDLLTAGKIAPRSMVTDTISLTELPERFESLRNDKSACKVLVDPWLTS